MDKNERALLTSGAAFRIIERLIDSLPKAVQLRKSSYGSAMRAAIDLLLADHRAEQRERIFAGVVRHRLVNRAIFSLHVALPRVAGWLARRVPIVGTYRRAIGEPIAPVILATAHFGPLFFAMLVLEPMLRGRRVIVVLREGALYLRNVVPIFERLGFEYVFDSQQCVRRLTSALQTDPTTAILYVFDTPTRGRREVSFLNATLSSSASIAYLADVGHARIFTTFWLWRNARPRMAFDHAFDIDRTRHPTVRRQLLVDRLYAALEEQVLATPEQWSAWSYVVERMIAVVEPSVVERTTTCGFPLAVVALP